MTDHACPLIASGMVGSRQGSAEAPYLACPAGLAQAAAQLNRVPLARGGVLHIVPGLICTSASGHDDVMRGEETQLWGAGLRAGDCCVLPGTHSKWAWMGPGGEIQRFQTFMTGELFALLSQHSILGRLMQPGSASPQDFAEGVRCGLADHAQATHLIFAARTAGLTGRIAPQGLPDFLSGLAIGIEVGSATQRQAPAAVTLLGDAALLARYETALQLAGIAQRRAPAMPPRRASGAWPLAAGLVEDKA